MRKQNSLIFIYIIFMVSCNPKLLILNSTNPVPSYPKVNGFVIIEDSSKLVGYNPQFIADISTKVNRFTINCDYADLQRLIKYKAKDLGSNCILIINNTLPNAWKNGCSQIEAKAYYVENFFDLESTIEWNDKRKLEIRDFKGSSKNRPYIASTASTINYYSYQKNITHKIMEVHVQTLFYCHRSYFKRHLNDSKTLEHEQIHFDLTELYARKFLHRLSSEAKGKRELILKNANIYNEIADELDIIQDKYDSEVYADRSKTSKWKDWTKSELQRYDRYKSKKLIFKDK